MWDPRSDTWTLFDDEKVRPLKGVNTHGYFGANDIKSKGNGHGGKAKPASPKRKETAGREAAVESDTEVIAEYRIPKLYRSVW